MARVNIGTEAFPCPMQTVLVGTMAKGRANFMAAAWYTRVSYKPPMLAVAVNARHLTAEILRGQGEEGVFSICCPDTDLMAEVDYVGLVSGRRADKSGVFTVAPGEATGAPLALECPLCVECRVAQAVPVGADILFVGDVAAVWAEEACLTDGVPDPEKLDPLLLTMPDNHYRRMGGIVGRAWHEGKALKR
ncbi:flavin reductase domain protein FMN-binding protein [Desulfovibrio sp. X2]|uniref:flavin reductase family protein n=1 Tax=Desulfovibrio sp. X2 TaxID=941449 RepID=UPI00035898B7|nr:flavin reductase family protein [Desulfovibrio sp. X2]EPR44746.1 flavin reductase domain protein FMN-binding protein [Desulfovibrio sp. X2]